eukprot:COSAG02_NODE_3099_length_7378_cov_3.046984_8_plen_83_part_00
MLLVQMMHMQRIVYILFRVCIVCNNTEYTSALVRIFHNFPHVRSCGLPTAASQCGSGLVCGGDLQVSTEHSSTRARPATSTS